MDNPLEIIPDIALFLGKGQNLVIAFLIGVGYWVRHTDKIPDRYVPSAIFIASFVVTPFFFSPYVYGVALSFIYAGISMMLYEAIIRHVENWIIRTFGEKPRSEEDLPKNPRPFKHDPTSPEKP